MRSGSGTIGGMRSGAKPWSPILHRHPEPTELAPALVDVPSPEGVPLAFRGEVRNVYDLGHHMLMVATDRVTVNGAVLHDGIPDKGKLVNAISLHWFEETREVCPNHLADDVDWPEAFRRDRDEIEPRSMLVHKATPIPVECTVHGYMSDSAFGEYLVDGTVGGVHIPSGVLRAGRLPERVVSFVGRGGGGLPVRREPLSDGEVRDRYGSEVIDRMVEAALTVYGFVHDRAKPLDVVIAEGTLQFGWIEGELCLIGDCFTPDTATYWASEAHIAGASPVRMGREFVAEWLEALGWVPPDPPPRLPEGVVLGVRERYLECFGRVTGRGKHLGLYPGWHWTSALGGPAL